MRQNAGLGRSIKGPSQRLIVGFVVPLLMVLGSGSAAAQQNFPAYTARPADTGIDGRSSVLFSHSIESGSMVVDAVEILNLAPESTEFDVYVVDIVSSATGSPTAAPRGVPPEGAGSWFAVSSDTVEIPSRQSQLVEFTMEVPIGTPPGDYTAVVVVEPHEAFGEGTVSTRTRIGLPAQIAVLAEVNLGVDLGAITTVRTDQGITINLPVTNTGDVTFSASGFTELDPWFGDRTTSVSMQPEGAFVSPGEQIQLTGLWRNPPPIGRYDITVTVEATVGNRQPVQYLSPAKALWLIPWSTIVFLLIAAAMATWVAKATRPTREERAKRRQEERDLVREFRKSRET